MNIGTIAAVEASGMITSLGLMVLSKNPAPRNGPERFAWAVAIVAWPFVICAFLSGVIAAFRKPKRRCANGPDGRWCPLRPTCAGECEFRRNRRSPLPFSEHFQQPAGERVHCRGADDVQ